MSNLTVAATSIVTPADVSRFQFGSRFGRLDPVCQLGMTAVEALGIKFGSRAAIGVLAATNAGSLATDVQYWRTRNEPGGVSPSLFVYTLPSSLIGEIAIRHGLTGPNLCLIGGSADLLAEAVDWLRHGEATACLCIDCDVVTAVAGAVAGVPVEARACAAFLQRGGSGAALTENDRDLKMLCARLRHPVS
jgi:3-oxoacyl-(acyl-carrier-protein) synthase